MAAKRQPNHLPKRVAASERRKLRARRQGRQGWLGLSMYGMVGWSVVVPTLLGVALGVWIDRSWPSPFSWTLMLLVGGLLLGCWNAWYWISLEQRALEREQKENHDASH